MNTAYYITLAEDIESIPLGEIVFTSNRRLENYLYLLGIRNIGYKKNWDGYTYWRYEVTPGLKQAFAHYAEIMAQKNAFHDSMDSHML
ncbi:MAG: hypothetical protein ACI4MU_05075 [Candidatus Ventricola sp.]